MSVSEVDFRGVKRFFDFFWKSNIFFEKIVFLKIDLRSSENGDVEVPRRTGGGVPTNCLQTLWRIEPQLRSATHVYDIVQRALTVKQKVHPFIRLSGEHFMSVEMADSFREWPAALGVFYGSGYCDKKCSTIPPLMFITGAGACSSRDTVNLPVTLPVYVP